MNGPALVVTEVQFAGGVMFVVDWSTQVPTQFSVSVEPDRLDEKTGLRGPAAG